MEVSLKNKILKFLGSNIKAISAGGAVLTIIIAQKLWNFSIFDKLCLKVIAGADRELMRHRPKRIILVRHGETPANLDSKVYAYIADNQIPLNDKGEKKRKKHIFLYWLKEIDDYFFKKISI